MGRNSWIMFGMIAVVIISILLVALLILVPQSQPITSGIDEDYESITESEYSYTQSKDISEDNMKETYSITTEDIKEGQSSKLYKPGNTNPFAEVAGSGSASGSGSSSNSGSASGSNSSNGGTTVTPYSADNK